MNLVLDGGSSIGNITQTDHGAIDAAARMARVAFDSAAVLNRGSTDLGMTAIEETVGAANNFAARSLDLVDTGFDYARDVNRDAVDAVLDGQDSSLDFASQTMSMTIAAMSKDADASRKQTSDQIERAFALANLHSRSEGGEAMDQSIKVLGWGGAAVASIAVLAMFRGKK
ncbi:hypothetical protein QT397_14800 [Microbulbifer sp. MKSA007]|nr:hypothetical protein QT397_14800 [Microbulbifer sp. MKSA007]